MSNKLKLIKKFNVLLWCLVFIEFPAHATEITGAGSTSFSPLVKNWNEGSSTGVSIKYSASTSGKGIQSIKNKEVDFGQADAPLSKAELDKNELFQFPSALVAFVVIANLTADRVTVGELKLDGETLGDIYLGNIKKWNDPRISSLNPKLTLSDHDIKVFYRNGETGSSYALTSYLNKHSPEWHQKLGAGMSVNWSTGTGIEKMKDMAQAIKDTPYSIGYVDLSMSIKESLRYIQLENNSDNFVLPNPEGVVFALSSSNLSEENGFSTNIADKENHPKSWPMVGVSYTIIPRVFKDVEKAKSLIKYFTWALNYGELRTFQADLIPIDKGTGSRIKSALNNLLLRQ